MAYRTPEFRDRYEAEEYVRRMERDYSDKIRYLERELMSAMSMQIQPPAMYMEPHPEIKKAPVVKPAPPTRSKLLLLL